MTRAIAAGLLLLAAACAGPATHQTHVVRVVDYTDKEGIVVGTVESVGIDDTLLCGIETPTGTHIARRICRFALESSFLQQRTQDMLRATRGPGASGYTRESGGRAYSSIGR